MNPQDLAEAELLLSHLSAEPALRSASHVDDVLRGYDEIEERLVAAGFPPTSPWWRATIERWYRSGRKQLVGRVGRRGGKSSTLSRLGVAEALYGHHDVPPGDVGTVAIVSTRKKEAGKRLSTVKAILDALGVAYRPCDEGVQVVGRRVAFCVYAASVQGVSGFTSIFVFCDEVSKWRDNDTGVNPATEVLASLRPTMKTMRNARIVLSSSPFSVLDAHYDAFEEGDNERQVVVYAPTWTANPTITEKETRDEEADEGTWLREYKAIPQAEVASSLLEEVDILECTRKKHTGDLPRMQGWTYAAAMDPATRTNSWTLVVVGQGPKGIRHVVLARQWTPKKGKPLQSEVVLREVRKLIEPYELKSVHTDQAGTDNLRAIIRLLKPEERVFLVECPWTTTNKAIAYDFLKKLIESKRVGLPADKWIRVDLLGIVKKITRNGVNYQLIERDGRHSDYAPSIALAVADARFPHKPKVKPPTEEQTMKLAKGKMLREREKERDRAKRFGALPATHRKRLTHAA